MIRHSSTRAVSFTVLIVVTAHVGAVGQTFVQVPELDPQNGLGPRLTMATAQAKLSRNLFAEIASKVTFVDAVSVPTRVYQFASDGV